MRVPNFTGLIFKKILTNFSQIWEFFQFLIFKLYGKFWFRIVKNARISTDKISIFIQTFCPFEYQFWILRKILVENPETVENFLRLKILEYFWSHHSSSSGSKSPKNLVTIIFGFYEILPLMITEKFRLWNLESVGLFQRLGGGVRMIFRFHVYKEFSLRRAKI